MNNILNNLMSSFNTDDINDYRKLLKLIFEYCFTGKECEEKYKIYACLHDIFDKPNCNLSLEENNEDYLEQQEENEIMLDARAIAQIYIPERVINIDKPIKR